MKSVICRCGHTQEMFDRATKEDMDEQRKRVCQACEFAAYDLAHPKHYDVRIGAMVTDETSQITARISNDPAAFVAPRNYSPRENVDDGDGFGK